MDERAYQTSTVDRAVRDVGEVPGAIHVASDHIASISEVLDELEARLNPVLRNVPREITKVSERAGSDIPLHETLLEQNERLETLRRRLVDLNERLAL